MISFHFWSVGVKFFSCSHLNLFFLSKLIQHFWFEIVFETVGEGPSLLVARDFLVIKRIIFISLPSECYAFHSPSSESGEVERETEWSFWDGSRKKWAAKNADYQFVILSRVFICLVVCLSELIYSSVAVVVVFCILIKNCYIFHKIELLAVFCVIAAAAVVVAVAVVVTDSFHSLIWFTL